MCRKELEKVTGLWLLGKGDWRCTILWWNRSDSWNPDCRLILTQTPLLTITLVLFQISLRGESLVPHWFLQLLVNPEPGVEGKILGASQCLLTVVTSQPRLGKVILGHSWTPYCPLLLYVPTLSRLVWGFLELSFFPVFFAVDEQFQQTRFAATLPLECCSSGNREKQL